MIANFNENPSSYEYQLSSIIQETSRGTESGRGGTSRSKRSQRVESWKNIKQKKSKRSSEVFGIIEGCYDACED